MSRDRGGEDSLCLHFSEAGEGLEKLEAGVRCKEKADGQNRSDLGQKASEDMDLTKYLRQTRQPSLPVISAAWIGSTGLGGGLLWH